MLRGSESHANVLPLSTWTLTYCYRTVLGDAHGALQDAGIITEAEERYAMMHEVSRCWATAVLLLLRRRGCLYCSLFSLLSVTHNDRLLA